MWRRPIVTHLIFATQFAQIALVVMSRAASDDIRPKGLVQPDAAFAATHWTNSLPLLLSRISCQIPLVDIVFCCGPTMQLTVERDVQDHSNYVIPKRVGKTFDDAALCEIVATVTPSRMSGIVS
jgi:fatty acid synthase subunit beta